MWEYGYDKEGPFRKDGDKIDRSFGASIKEEMESKNWKEEEVAIYPDPLRHMIVYWNKKRSSSYVYLEDSKLWSK